MKNFWCLPLQMNLAATGAKWPKKDAVNSSITLKFKIKNDQNQNWFSVAYNKNGGTKLSKVI